MPPWPFPGPKVTFLCSVHCHKRGFMCCFLQSLDCPHTHFTTQLSLSFPPSTSTSNCYSLPIQLQLDSHCPWHSPLYRLCGPLLSVHRRILVLPEAALACGFCIPQSHCLLWGRCPSFLDLMSLQCPSWGSWLQVGPSCEPGWLPAG